jgi:hypothetical protein
LKLFFFHQKKYWYFNIYFYMSETEEVPEGQAAKVESGEQAPEVEMPEEQEEEGVEAEMHNSMFALSFYYVIFVEVF